MKPGEIATRNQSHFPYALIEGGTVIGWFRTEYSALAAIVRNGFEQAEIFGYAFSADRECLGTSYYCDAYYAEGHGIDVQGEYARPAWRYVRSGDVLETIWYSRQASSFNGRHNPRRVLELEAADAEAVERRPSANFPNS